MNKEHVKQTALEMVAEAGLINLSRRELCERAGIPDGSFPHVMGCNFAEFLQEIKADGPTKSILVVSKSRVDPVLRRQQILDVAIGLACEGNYTKVTREAVADGAGVSPGLVTRYFATMNQLKKAIMRAAVQGDVAIIVAQGLANGDTQAKKATPELKSQALELIANF